MTCLQTGTSPRNKVVSGQVQPGTEHQEVNSLSFHSTCYLVNISCITKVKCSSHLLGISHSHPPPPTSNHPVCPPPDASSSTHYGLKFRPVPKMPEVAFQPSATLCLSLRCSAFDILLAASQLKGGLCLTTTLEFGSLHKPEKLPT